MLEMKITLIQVNRQWLRAWGKAWQLQHPQQNSSLLDWLLQTTHVTVNVIPEWFESRMIAHLVDSIEQEKTGNLIAATQIFSTNWHTSHLTSGLQLPYIIKDSRNRHHIEFKPVNFDVSITPILLDKTQTLLNIKFKHDDISTTTTPDTLPKIFSQTLQTQIRMKLGSTILLSSLSTHQKNSMKNAPSIFAKIPILGPLLRHNQQQNKQHQWLIFISTSLQQGC